MDVITFLRPEGRNVPSRRKAEISSGISSSFKAGGGDISRKGDYSFSASIDFSAGTFFTMPDFSGEPRQGAAHESSSSSIYRLKPQKASFESVSASAVSPAYSSFGAFALDSREQSAYSSASRPLWSVLILIVLILCAGLCAIAPALQNRFGYYYIEENISLADDGAAYSAMNSILNSHGNFFAAKDSSLEGATFDIVEPVTYSTYTVRGGDTVSGIALRFGLDNISTILSVNEIENARRIRTGQALRIPSMDGVLYKVQAGDSLVSIASKFSAPLEAILDANDLTDSAIAVGQELFIPGARMSTYDLRKAMGELFIYPIRGRLTSRYGPRADPFTGASSFHTGVDLAAPVGTSIKASSDGRVAAAGWQNIYGNYAIITHAGGYQTLYAHMSSLSVKRGQYITQGDEVGKVGSTGYSTGPHLHFSVYKNGKTVDPFSVLD